MRFTDLDRFGKPGFGELRGIRNLDGRPIEFRRADSDVQVLLAEMQIEGVAAVKNGAAFIMA
jgi:hypothetical protein